MLCLKFIISCSIFCVTRRIPNPISLSSGLSFKKVSLLFNISYYASRKINKRVKNSYLDIYDMENWGGETGTDFSNFDKYAFETFIESGRGIQC